MCARFERFLRSEDGAVTVDWIVLTGGIALLGFAVVLPLATGSLSIGDALASFIDMTPTGPGWGG